MFLQLSRGSPSMRILDLVLYDDFFIELFFKAMWLTKRYERIINFGGVFLQQAPLPPLLRQLLQQHPCRMNVGSVQKPLALCTNFMFISGLLMNVFRLNGR